MFDNFLWAVIPFKKIYENNCLIVKFKLQESLIFSQLTSVPSMLNLANSYAFNSRSAVRRMGSYSWNSHLVTWLGRGHGWPKGSLVRVGLIKNLSLSLLHTWVPWTVPLCARTATTPTSFEELNFFLAFWRVWVRVWCYDVRCSRAFATTGTWGYLFFCGLDKMRGIAYAGPRSLATAMCVMRKMNDGDFLLRGTRNFTDMEMSDSLII